MVPLVVSLVYRDDPLGCTVNYRRGNEGTVAAGASTTSVELASPGLVTLTNTIAAVPLAPGQSRQQESIVFPGINCDPDVFEVTATVTADSTNAVDEPTRPTTREAGRSPPDERRDPRSRNARRDRTLSTPIRVHIWRTTSARMSRWRSGNVARSRV